MRGFSLCVLSAFAITAQAQDAELGVRYWYSKSTTTRSHNAQEAAPVLGNPTSILTYDNLNAHAVELHARKTFGAGWFAKGNAGLGWVTRGSFDDEDYFAGQVKFSDSTSSVRGNELAYGSVDIGRELWRLRNGVAGIFVGYHYWSEHLDAYGATFTVGGGPAIPSSEPVISNEVTWHSLRVGLTSAARLGPRTRLSFEAAWIPYARVRDEDSHWLRQDPGDLGPAPNIFIEGRGHGLQLELEWRHVLRNAWEVGAGLRHWWLRARSGNREAVGTRVPLTELESQRTGLTLGVTRRW
jgi:hypothetical protein